MVINYLSMFQRMLDRARIRREKLESKLPPSERKPLTENNILSPSKQTSFEEKLRDTPTKTLLTKESSFTMKIKSPRSSNNTPSRKSSLKETSLSKSDSSSGIENCENKSSPKTIMNVKKHTRQNSSPKVEMASKNEETKIISKISDSISLEINIVHQEDTEVNVEVEEREITLSKYLEEKQAQKMTDDSDSTSSFSRKGKYSNLFNCC